MTVLSVYRALVTTIVALICSGMLILQAGAADTIAPLHQRFATETNEVPDFQKHVIPLLGKLGCNGRACHGSFQGRGGFQLSLFGYDFTADYQSLVDSDSGRVDIENIDQSFILSKPTDADMHEGGQRYEIGSWQHRVLRSWIAGGASFDKKAVQALTRLQITPATVHFNAGENPVSLSVTAHWEDGSSETVTGLCRFHSNDDAIATVDDRGNVQTVRAGDTHIVVTYDNAVVAVPVIRPYDNPQPPTFESSPHPVDALVNTKLRKLRITPSPICSDTDFIRRASLDIAGILPSAQAVQRFLSDPSANKRASLIDDLLESPGYAAWWATRFSDWTGNNEEQLTNALPFRNKAGKLWYEWLRIRIADNMPYDEIVAGIVTAESRQSDESYADYCESMTQACQDGNEHMFAARDGLPLYWSRRDFQKPEDRAIGFAYTFLAVRIECAQCHKHPFDRWSKDDFASFSKLFLPIQSNGNSIGPDARDTRQQMISAITDGKDLKGGKLRREITMAAKQGAVVPFGELLINTKRVAARARREARQRGRKNPMRIPAGKILGELDQVELDEDTRPALMDWLRSPDNPYFARAIVNRVWSNYFGIGIIDPTDDMNLANPPSNAELLDYLATEFIRSGYDLKWLHRTITTSDAYARSTATNETNATDRSNFARHIPRRLPAEVIHDAIQLATVSDGRGAQLRTELDSLAIANGKPRRKNNADFAMTVFGASIRESNCDCDRSDSPSLMQSIYMRNDRDIDRLLRARNGWVAQACQSIGQRPPRTKSDDLDKAALQKSQKIKQRFTQRLLRFKRQPAERQAKLRPQLKQDYRRMADQLRLLGYETPTLGMLIKLDNFWKELRPLQRTSPSEPTVSIDKIVESAYLRTLSRYPETAETETAVNWIHQSETPAQGIESLMWALINTKEFIVTH